MNHIYMKEEHIFYPIRQSLRITPTWEILIQRTEDFSNAIYSLVKVVSEEKNADGLVVFRTMDTRVSFKHSEEFFNYLAKLELPTDDLPF